MRVLVTAFFQNEFPGNTKPSVTVLDIHDSEDVTRVMKQHLEILDCLGKIQSHTVTVLPEVAVEQVLGPASCMLVGEDYSSFGGPEL